MGDGGTDLSMRTATLMMMNAAIACCCCCCGGCGGGGVDCSGGGARRRSELVGRIALCSVMWCEIRYCNVVRARIYNPISNKTVMAEVNQGGCVSGAGAVDVVKVTITGTHAPGRQQAPVAKGPSFPRSGGALGWSGAKQRARSTGRDSVLALASS